MPIYQITTDSSGLYFPNSAAGNNNLNGAAVGGNLSAIMKNSAIFRITQVEPTYLQNSEINPTSSPEGIK